MPVTLNDLAAFATGGSLAALVTVLFRRKKMRAEGRSEEIRGELQIVESAVALTQTLNEEIRTLHDRLEVQENARVRLAEEIRSLRVDNLKLQDRLRRSDDSDTDGGLEDDQ